MIIDRQGMIKIEEESGLSVSALMKKAGTAIADALRNEIPLHAHIVFLAGKGNNGGDALVAANELSTDYKCSVYLCDGKITSKTALSMQKKLPKEMFMTERQFHAALKKCDAVVDGVYGFSFHGPLKKEVRDIFRLVNESGKPVYSIDINSGCESDSGRCDVNAIRSKITYALDCYKPFHMFKKDHNRFERVELLSMDLPHPPTGLYHEMDEETFFKNFPHRPENAYKGIYGKILLVSGCYGMAGASCLNIIGANTIGASYINAAVPEEIYPIVASKFNTPVFHPFAEHSYYEVLEPLISEAKAIGFGSGAVYMTHKENILDLLLQNARSPIVLDAEALRLLKHNTYILRFAKAPVILTPHIGEFSYFTGLPIEVIQDDKVNIAKAFAKENRCIVVLKGPHTIVASPAGDIYINQSGNQALAQAGSGDLLTGIMTALLSLTSDVYTAVCMAVWVHGKLSELGTKDHSIQGFKLERFPELMDELLYKHGF